MGYSDIIKKEYVLENLSKEFIMQNVDHIICEPSGKTYNELINESKTISVRIVP